MPESETRRIESKTSSEIQAHNTEKDPIILIDQPVHGVQQRVISIQGEPEEVSSLIPKLFHPQHEVNASRVKRIAKPNKASTDTKLEILICPPTTHFTSLVNGN